MHHSSIYIIFRLGCNFDLISLPNSLQNYSDSDSPLQVVSLTPAPQLPRPSHLDRVWTQIKSILHPTKPKGETGTKCESVLYVVARRQRWVRG